MDLNLIYASYVDGLGTLLEYSPTINNATVATLAYSTLYYTLRMLDDYNSNGANLSELTRSVSSKYSELDDYCREIEGLTPIGCCEYDDTATAKLLGLLRLMSMQMLYRIDGDIEEDLSIDLFGVGYNLGDWFKSNLYHMLLITSDFVAPSALYDGWNEKAQTLYCKDWLNYSLIRAVYYIQDSVQKYPKAQNARFPMIEAVEWLTYAILWEEPTLYYDEWHGVWNSMLESYPDLPIDPIENEESLVKSISKLLVIVEAATNSLITDEKFLRLLPFNVTGECLEVLHGANINSVSFPLDENDRALFLSKIHDVQEIYGVGLDYIDKPDNTYSLTFICEKVTWQMSTACELLWNDCRDKGISVEYKFVLNSRELKFDRIYWLHWDF